MSLGKSFIESAISRVLYYKKLADQSFAQLRSPLIFIFSRMLKATSIAIIMQHLAGNMLSRWTDFLHSDGEKEWRHRDAEFENQDWTQEALLAYWEKGWNCFIETLSNLNETDLLKPIQIRAETLLVIDAINRQLAHYPYHVGQIVYVARMIKGAEWKNLSIPKGHSQAFNDTMKSKPPSNP
jgi:hypothetical protein